MRTKKKRDKMHNLETFADGTVAFASAREVAWHKLGTVTEDAMTAEEALDKAQLNSVVKVSDNPVTVEIAGQKLTIPNKFVTYREHAKTGITPLGVVGNRYVPIQNAEAFSFLNYLVDESGAIFETAGSINNGRQVFMSIKMPESMTFNGADAVDMYIVATNSHDGSKSFTAAVTPIRPVCTNTINLALRAAKSKVTLRHTVGATQKVQQARELLGIVFKYQDAFQEQVNELIDQTMTNSQFDQFVERMFPYSKAEDTSARGITKVNIKREALQELWVAPTQKVVANTKWAAYNAVAEYADWILPVRGENSEKARAQRIVTGGVDFLKNRALQLLTR